ncbi:5-methyltetrahydropteroyltriglutamate--homocysteine methyltransferase [Actinidia chinensis var. chinensis]|uniref:5-methyltetrahydropteroyltriglutamate--homocysteine methyltransferase n=1 Tax=Actinidia chinensis var. chinensis TaxID=1590841 RepID=A0A2R6Q4S0_ACTCC|nr:5-methyltetrahydropteroyltriglutamate--homocysteine methyltransferase [Actinidia chinensis var. chinensis]
MDPKNWCSSGTRTIRLGRAYANLNDLAITGASRTPRWKLLWKKLLREKRKMMMVESSSSAHVRVPYDEHTYAQNFDEGLMWDDEPDSLSRSFSVRFAHPSSVFLNK